MIRAMGGGVSGVYSKQASGDPGKELSRSVAKDGVLEGGSSTCGVTKIKVCAVTDSVMGGT